MTIVERFLKYVSFDTQSDDSTGTTPSTEKQFRLAEYLVEELRSIGMSEVEMDAHGYVYATLPANVDNPVPTIGFIAHIDTSPDASGAGVKPRIVRNYDGTDIVLDAQTGIVSTVAKFPELLDHVGEDIIVTDGHTLLGADDKAGIAEIVTAMEYLIAHPEIPHGKVRVGFNPDEEIGLGAHKFDVEKFGCEWAYTMDGSERGELEYENFNAASAKIEITGVSVHPGYAKDKMINAARVATELVQKMPQQEVPEETEGYEGFFHLTGIEGGVERATVSYIIRDHDRQRFEDRKAMLRGLVQGMNIKYGAETLRLTLTDQYRNMREKVEPMMHIVDIARQAMEEVGIRPIVKPIRGGTDGAQLSFMGLPCPNIFAGGLNFHGAHEFLPIPNLEKASEVIVHIVRLTARR
ncbi:peptidase T [Alloprevotella sp. OH1205_COT-284]|uniref:peptidase T n=1 Tax=Alloprevotella sp. OH1205_COT-284 TaxID=2491043 RepID=UPI000F5F201A|nr:peptidase T [Alloprevotella sp. OH1205_COT-284]RRD79896.1 peptidase T [Alloprevotella sp. OH1205_COT-284]